MCPKRPDQGRFGWRSVPSAEVVAELSQGTSFETIFGAHRLLASVSFGLVGRRARSAQRFGRTQPATPQNGSRCATPKTVCNSRTPQQTHQVPAWHVAWLKTRQRLPCWPHGPSNNPPSVSHGCYTSRCGRSNRPERPS